jgi:hypothetical protein
MVGLFAGATALLTTFGFASSANAIILTLELDNASFTDGGNISGSFRYDTDSNTYLNDYNIFAGGSTTITNDYTYAPSTSDIPGDTGIFTALSDTELSINGTSAFNGTDSDRDILFTFENSLNTLTSVNDTTNIVIGSSGERAAQGAFNNQTRSVSGGLLRVTGIEGSSQPVPFEVESGIGFALLGLGAAWKLRKKAKAKVEA